MSLRRTSPLTFNPKGLSDAIDGSTVFSGAMYALQNLIPDPSTRGLWQSRPAAIKLVDFSVGGGPFSSGFSSGFATSIFPIPVGLISCLKVIGNIAYGMVAAGSGNKDFPFAYNLSTNLFISISGITPSNLPTSPASSGAWKPPTMALVGTNLLVTHPGFDGSGGNYFGWFDVSNPAAITWNAGNLTGAITFSSAPIAVANFNGRAYWAVNPAAGGQPFVVFSDVLVPRNVTSAAQALTFDDNILLTALAGLPLNNQLGGIIQALIVFKGVANIYQVTGDAATSNLAKNALNVATGTLSPNSIKPTSKGLAFIAPDGLRFIDFNANVSDPIGVDGMGKTLPFIYSLVPSRVTAAANGSVYRVTTQDASMTGSPFVEYWYDIPRGIWSGAHTCPMSCIEPYNNTFICAPINAPAALYQSDYVQNSTSTFSEFGSALQIAWTTTMLPDTNRMAENAMVETTIYMALNANDPYTVLAQDQNGAVLSSATILSPGQTTQWGGFQWGHAVWSGGHNPLFPRQVNWPEPVVFRRMQITVTGPASDFVRIGTLQMRYEELGYLQQVDAA